MLSLNEIRRRACEFVLNWKEKANTAREEADAQTFETEFFNIFGVPRNKMAIFEHKVKLLDGSSGYIDLLWKGYILIEMKSPGKDLQKAYEQAKRYAQALPDSELPKVILISDFCNFHYYNLEKDGELTAFTLEELAENIELFSFLAGYKEIEYKKADAVNIEAAEKMGRLHDTLKEIGYTGHRLELYLVRLLFCLFADDTGIFEHDLFIKYILRRTNQDGSDLALHIQKIFEVLNTPKSARLKTLDEELNQFPYINGGLFAEHIDTADFNHTMRENLIECCQLDWSRISPAIFGAMFQSVMNKEERHALGAHYTSEENILKLIHPLFLDELWERFEKAKKLGSRAKATQLNDLHDHIARLKFLDPACGCGNFLVVAYRELRLLELAIIEELKSSEQQVLDVGEYIKVNVNQFYGIELEEFPSQIAQTAMWLIDHQMNRLVAERFGQYFVRIPLKEAANIMQGNALKTDWENIVPKTELNYILGNPPFLGARVMTKEQSLEVVAIFNGMKNVGNLDYVCAWYKKTCDYIQSTNIRCAFVSTNSICQGQQVPVLWKELFENGIHINFAHQTFKWSNEARGKAAVYCIIVGFSLQDEKEKTLFIYEDIKAEPKAIKAKQINAYLMDAENVFIESRTEPISNVPEIGIGNKPIDDGNYLFTEAEYKEFIEKEPSSKPFFKRWYGADEFINNKVRMCLWVGEASPDILRKMPHVLERIENVRKFRLNSKSEGTRKIADTPTRFHVENMPSTNYIAIPETSSENRKYIPIGFLEPNVLCSNAMRLIPHATLYHFGILTSQMHMAWMRVVGGRLELRYRYSKDVVYNNFPFPKATKAEQEAIAQKAHAVLEARTKYPDSSLADLYDPLTMPKKLAKAHKELDIAVDKLYSSTKFKDDGERVSFLFEMYKKITRKDKT